MKPLLLLLLVFPFVVGAQSFTVRGVVRAKADRVALPGVSVVEKGTSHGTSTDAQGRFTLVTTGPTPRLRASFIGYVTKEVAITKNEGSLVVFLEEDRKTLSEVVVVGYGAPVAKRSISGAVSSVSGSAPGVMIRGARSIAAAPSADAPLAEARQRPKTPALERRPARGCSPLGKSTISANGRCGRTSPRRT